MESHFEFAGEGANRHRDRQFLSGKTLGVSNGNKKTGAAVSVEMESALPSVFTVKSQWGKTLALGKKCKVSVIFTPLDDTTAETGSLKILDNATGSPQSVSLSGMGRAAKKKK